MTQCGREERGGRRTRRRRRKECEGAFFRGCVRFKLPASSILSPLLLRPPPPPKFFVTMVSGELWFVTRVKKKGDERERKAENDGSVCSDALLCLLCFVFML